MAARLLRSWVRIPPGAWIFVCCECRVLSGRGLCDELITRPEESYRLRCVVMCDLETSRIGAPYIYGISSLRVKCKKSIGRLNLEMYTTLKLSIPVGFTVFNNCPGSRSFKSTVTLKAIVTMQCTKAGSARGIKDPYSSPRPELKE